MTDPSYILAFDTSAAHCAVALRRGETTVAQRYETMLKGQAEALIPLAEDVLAEAGIHWSDLTRIGVGTGPGNFTGIRISVAAARGLALSLGIPAIGVTGFEAVAAQFDTPLALVSLPAPRDMAYLQIIHNGAPKGPAAQFSATTPIDLSAFDLPPDTPVYGHNADLLAPAQGQPDRHIDPQALAANIARIAASRPIGERPKPFYVRAADAAPARDTGPKILT